MKIVLNSDILLNLKFAGGILSEELSELCRVCQERGVAIAIPETTLLEFERRHEEFAIAEAARLAQALALLDRFSIGHDRVNPQDVVKPPQLLALLRATGVTVEVVDPTHDDLREAHARACRHLPPSIEKKSDEMRDVVIWMVAMTTARRSSGAVLIAQDLLFHDARVDEEANAVGLIRVKAVSDAINHVLGVRPAPERLAATLLSSLREDLATVGIDIPLDANRYDLSNIAYTLEDERLLAHVEFQIADEQEGELHFVAEIAIDAREGTITGVTLNEIESAALSLPTNEISLATNRAVDLLDAAAEAGLSDVAAFGGRSESEN